MVNNTDKMFEKGKAFLAENNTLAALSCFEKAYSDGASPEIKSYLGLCLALERGQIRDGIALCRQAIAEETGNPVHYLHLARIYLKEKRKDEAIEILRTGLSFGDNEQSREILERIGTRKKAVFRFLPREHFANKYVGILLKKLRLR
jgi:tetratricopeptide (TPR) repeat protein